MTRRIVVALSLVALVCGVATFAAQAAVADGDPASDVLLFDDVYLPLTPVSGPLGKQLTEAVAATNKAGFKIKVALIATATDLGSVPILFNQPGQYAKFLGAELLALYKERLLIVMPVGFGVYRGGADMAKEAASLAGIKIGAGSDGLAQAALAALKRLADTKPPSAKARAGSAKRGTKATLHYLLSDDSGSAGAKLSLRRGSKTVASFSVAVKPLHGSGGSVTWKVPAGIAKGTLTFCIVGDDAAGHKSAPSCAAFRIQ
jgi:hypothetical protein